MTVEYYDKNAKDFFLSTYQIDATELYNEFLPLLSPGSHILDAGCGSGRDTQSFIRAGFKVTAFDASQCLAEMAGRYTGQMVEVCEFSHFQSEILFDAIWACASLLHVPVEDLPAVFTHLTRFLKPEGIFYCSFKLGYMVSVRDGRYFTNLDEVALRGIIDETELKIYRTWISPDLRDGRKSEKWLNALLRKTSSDKVE